MPEFHHKATEYIVSLPFPQKEICHWLRELILGNFPHMQEEFKWNFPAYYFNGKRICLIGGFKAHANIELFYGAHLLDTQGRIAGVGKHTRHIKLRTREDIDPNYLVELVQQSIALSLGVARR